MQHLRIVLVLYLVLVLHVLCFQKPFTPQYSRLRKYNVDPRSVSVSGISNGAAFAVQMAFIYSSLISGCGSFAGSAYPMAYMIYNKQLTSMIVVKDFYPHIDRWSQEGAIDNVANLKRTRAYIFQGAQDLIVPKYFNFDIVREFKHYGSAVKAELHRIPAGHCVPTDNFPPRGDYIPLFGSMQAICNVGYQGVNHMFKHFYGPNFVWPISNNATPTGQLFKFDQNEFFKYNFAEGGGLNNAGFMYVPRSCHWNKIRCGLHVAFHGAGLPLFTRLVADGYSEFVQNSGYLQAADANNIIILFPEVKPANIPSWDIWGINGKTFLFKNGTHPLAISKMIRRVIYGI